MTVRNRQRDGHRHSPEQEICPERLASGRRTLADNVGTIGRFAGNFPPTRGVQPLPTGAIAPNERPFAFPGV